MAISPFLFAKLSADANITDLVAKGIHAGVAPQDAEPPFLTYEEFDPERVSTMGSDADLCDGHIRVHCWARKFADAHLLALAVRRSLARYRGSAFPPAAPIEVDDIFVHPGGASLWDEASKSWHLVRDFRVIYRET